MTMFVPDRMTKVNVLLFSKYLGEVTRQLGESGLVHLVPAADEAENTLLHQMDTDGDVRVIEQMLARCDVLLDALGVEVQDSQPAAAALDQEEISGLFEKIDKLYRVDADRVAKLIARHSGIDQSRRELENFPLQSLRVETLRNLSRLHVEAGILEGEAFLRARQALSEDALFIQYPDTPGQVLVLTSRKRHYAVDDVLDKFGFQRLEIPEQVTSGTVEEKRAALQGELEELRQELNNARLSIVALGEEYGGVLLSIRRQLRELLTIREAQAYFGKASQFVCITGWMPSDQLPLLQRLVDKYTDGTGS
ncbi:MAG: hypothetical protein J6S21_06380, partial [Victivallales bacterium]|nr:hypothetical protein [Victivallales bacterium]